MRKDSTKSGKKVTVFAYPDQGVSGANATKIISGLMQETVPSLPKLDANLTHREAARLIYQYLRDKEQQ